MPAAQDDLRVDTAIGPLLLRRPVTDDLPAVWAVHGDPRTNRHNPAGPDADVAASRDRLRSGSTTGSGTASATPPSRPARGASSASPASGRRPGTGCRC